MQNIFFEKLDLVKDLGTGSRKPFRECKTWPSGPERRSGRLGDERFQKYYLPNSKLWDWQKIGFIIMLGIMIFITPLAVQAQSAPALGVLPECAATGNCGYCDFIKLAVNTSRLGFGLLGGITLAFFGWGGFILLLSAGNREKISRGWQILLGSMMGLAVIVLAWVIVNFVVWALVSGNISTIGDVKIFPNDANISWWEGYCSGGVPPPSP